MNGIKTSQELRTVLRGSDFLEVTFVDHQPSVGDDNSDRFTFEISTPGGQSCEVNGVEVDKVLFTIVGNFELNDFLACMMKLAELRGG